VPLIEIMRFNPGSVSPLATVVLFVNTVKEVDGFFFIAVEINRAMASYSAKAQLLGGRRSRNSVQVHLNPLLGQPQIMSGPQRC